MPAVAPVVVVSCVSACVCGGGGGGGGIIHLQASCRNLVVPSKSNVHLECSYRLAHKLQIVVKLNSTSGFYQNKTDIFAFGGTCGN